MENHEAAEILRAHQVDRTDDDRPAKEVLVSMISRGYLPGELLAGEVQVTPAADTITATPTEADIWPA